jgi:hypothetical protein
MHVGTLHGNARQSTELVSMIQARCRFGIAVAALLFCLHPAHAQSTGACVVQRIEGTAMVSAGGSPPRAVQTGQTLAAADTMRTQSQSRITMACANNLKVVLGPDSVITVEGLLAAEAQTFGLRLLDGIVGFIFKGSGGGVQVRTPSAVAAVRSTEWAMRWSNGVSEVFTREGTVAVSADAGSVRLGPGDGVDVSDSGEFKPVVQWRPPRIARFGELLGADW